jgi:arylsulfatase A-like enzyme/Tfp pilus assembly protein PilF
MGKRAPTKSRLKGGGSQDWLPHIRFRKRAWIAVLVSLILLAGCQSARQPAAPSQEAAVPPLRHVNVVLVTIDTLRADHVHCYGYRDIETPNLDALAARGVLFENAVVQTPLTPPSHASIFTGQNPNVHKVRNTGGFILPSSARPLARILSEAGWDTAAFVGSAVLKRLFGFNNGFAVYDDEMPRPGRRNEYREDPERKASAVVDRAVAWMEQRAGGGKPFFLWVHLYDPHIPYQPPAEFARKYAGRLYDGEIAYADQQLGRLFAAVAKAAPGGDTITAVMSDHGESLGEHGEYTHGVFLYDATLHVPWIMAGPGVPAGVRVKQQSRSIDFLPTLLAVMGSSAPTTVQGVSLVPTFSNSPVDAAGASYAESLYPKMNMNWSELRAVRTDRWKLVWAPRPELYDLAADPRETKNLFTQNQREVEGLKAKLSAFAGAAKVEKVETAMVDERVMDQLKSLGYLSGAGKRTYELDRSGLDPKDGIEILHWIDEAEGTAPGMTEERRISLLERALEKDPKNPSLFYQLGGRLEKNGRYDRAMQLYRTALSRGVESGRLHSRLADLLLRQGDKDSAIAEYENAARINPADLDSQNNLATAYLEKGRLPEAERVFQWVLANDAGSAMAQNGMGLVSIQKNDFQAARGYFEKAASLDPDLVEAYMNLGLIYEMQGDPVKAKASFKTFLAKASPAQYGDIIPRVRDKLATLP